MSSASTPVLCRRPAMNTWFEFILPGDDSENLSAIGEAALDEVERIEKLLSRFDPASEVSRIHREAPEAPVLVDREFAEIFETCRMAWQRTEGFFDITATGPQRGGFDSIEFNRQARTIFFHSPDVRLDFGAYGKGYALDCAARLLNEYGVRDALLHGGTSSVLALGTDDAQTGWRIGIRHPLKPDSEVQQIILRDRALSTSAAVPSARDIVDPHSGIPVRLSASCSVIANDAATAEIFSTALLCMGKERALAFLAKNKQLGFQTIWNNSPEQSSVTFL